jgi:membrane-associated phospholipid phosphatase/protein-S-isoprenylcysteine O-methyltransferase Ste14
VEKTMNTSLAKGLYGLLFTAALPLLLVIWAAKTRQVVALSAVHSWVWGLVAAGFGLLLMALGTASLWRLGGGLPMNAFPPPRYVSGGIYRVFSHPIYLGFAFVCVGLAIAFGSASGLWLVSTTVILASAGLVLGYELPDMQQRFGEALLQQHLLLPDDQSQLTPLERLRCYLTILLPWFVLYEAVIALGVPADAKPAYLPFESQLPVWPWTEIFYGSVYVVVALVPLVARTRHALRWFSSRALLSMVIVFPLYLAVPLIAPPRSFVPTGVLGNWLNFDRLHDSAASAFPSYHVIWAFLAAEVMGRTPWQRRVWGVWAVLVSASCVTTGMHAFVDVLAGLLIVWVVVRMERIWSFLRNSAEAIANSWREWRIGPVRIINHGAYAGAGVFLGIWILDTLLGPGKGVISVAIFLGGTIGAALWAQFIEGSPVLLRPLGFYGGMIGTSAGGIAAAWLSGTSIWLVLSALVVAAPWIQGIGRLRCLVQGCCHGRATNENLGIRYEHARSRVCQLASLRGVPIHATPLYSLLWNVAVALIVTRLYLLHTTAAMVGGVYLILSGIGRFVEEAYRGEPQTPIFWGLRLYQWVAIVCVILGAVITTLVRTPLTPEPVPHFSSTSVALACGFAAWFVSGVDFPESSRRFSRLT